MLLGRALLKHSTSEHRKQINLVMKGCITEKSAHRFYCFSGTCAAGKVEVRQTHDNSISNTTE